MRLRLLLRRLTVSSPRMAVRSALPWPVRWVVVAIVLGFCAAIGLWAFELGKDIAGIDQGSKEALARVQQQLETVQTELETVKQERDYAQSIANTAGTLVTAEKASHERALEQIKELEAQTRKLRDDLGFYEKLIPVAGGDGVAIRGLQAEARNDGTVKWQVLVIQSNKNAAEFRGQLELTFTGVTNGQPWTASLPGGRQTIQVKQHGRLEGMFVLPAQGVLKGVTAKIMDAAGTKAVQSIKL